MRLIHPEMGKLEQGAVFNCAYVPEYSNCKCWGIILTARCDLAHDKQSVVNYLPVVKFSDWILRGSLSLLSKRIRPELERDIFNHLQKKGVSEKLRAIFPLEDIIQKETKGDEQTALLRKCQDLRTVSTISKVGDVVCPQAKDIVRIAGKKCDKLIEELIEQKLGEYYFLQSVDVYDKPTEGFVVLMRNLRAMSCDLARRIVAGYSPEPEKTQASHSGVLIFDHEPICMVTGVLRSPDIEHLAQQFANLFVRIGLEDHPDEAVIHHQNLSKSL